MQVALRCWAVSSAAVAKALALCLPAFLPPVAPPQISAKAASSATTGQPDFPFAALSIDPSTAAAKTAHSFAASQKASERTAPSRGKTTHRRSAESDADAASVYRWDRRKRMA